MYITSQHTIHQASEEIISQRIALKPSLYIQIITVTKHPNTNNGQPARTTASVYGSGLRLAITVGCAGLLRTMPDYFQSTSNYAGLLPVYSGQLGRTQGFSAPAPRTSLGLGETTYRLPVSPVPVQFTSTVAGLGRDSIIYNGGGSSLCWSVARALGPPDAN